MQSITLVTNGPPQTTSTTQGHDDHRHQDRRGHPRGQRAGPAQHAKVLVSAQKLFAEQGLDAQIDEIARDAGVVGTVYRHFPTKEDLLRRSPTSASWASLRRRIATSAGPATASPSS